MSKILGIDVSAHNGALDWAKIKAAGIRFAIIRSGYGVSHTDAKFTANVKGAIAQGIPFGVYHFSYALNAAGAQAEAKYVLSLLAPYKSKVTLPVFFDFEYDTVAYASKQGVTLGRQAFNAHTKAFCDMIQAAGYRAGTYYNLDYYNRYVDRNALSGYVQWYAQYASKPSISNYDLWQYSSSYTIPGCNCSFDVNELKNTALLTASSNTTTQSKKEEIDMTKAEMEKLIDERIQKALSGKGTTASDWAKEELAAAVAAGITDGTRPQGYATREEVAAMALRAVKQK